MVWCEKSTPSRTVPQPLRGGAALGQKIPRPLQHGPQGRNEFQENDLMESGQFGIFVAEFVILWRGQKLVIGAIETGYPNGIFHFANEDIQVVSLNTFFYNQSLGHMDGGLIVFWHVQNFWSHAKTMRMTLVTQYCLLEYTWIWTESSSRWLPCAVASCDWEFLFFYVLCWTAKHLFTSNTSDVDGHKWRSLMSTNILICS